MNDKSRFFLKTRLAQFTRFQCSQTCECSNEAYCHPLNGTCICMEGFRGDQCDQKSKYIETLKCEFVQRFIMFRKVCFHFSLSI